MTRKFHDYDLKVIDEIAEHIVSPSAVQELLTLAGKPIELVLKGAEKVPILKKVPETVQLGIEKGLRVSIGIGQSTYSEVGIVGEFARMDPIIKGYTQAQQASLETKDKVADTFDSSNAILMGLEGALMGAATSVCGFLPGAQVFVPALVAADVAASMTFLSRHSSQVAACYGFPDSDPKNIPHIIASLVPQTESDDEGFFAAKLGVAYEIREASKYMAKLSGKQLNDLIAKGEVPALMKIVNIVAARLGVVITEKELGMLVPIVGALLNGSVNVAFQQVSHTATKDYFRRIILNEQFSPERVTDKIAEVVEQKKKKRNKQAA